MYVEKTRSKTIIDLGDMVSSFDRSLNNSKLQFFDIGTIPPECRG